jgi:bifunctional DNA-binding transcriptional regulator/antitoxin component of YhaV-PrlF toxin-antitoxin module
MTDTSVIKVAQRGVVTLPKSLREAYGLEAGDLLTVLDLGGVFVLSPRQSEIDALANRISKSMEAKGETLENMLQVLREERENYEA